jgi:polyphosphate kinase
LVELQARLDEERNIAWARELEQAGVHVVYGFVGLKTHCKVALVVRRDVDRIRRYVHLGTGNYNPQTARVYTDLGLFTCDDSFADDVSALFNYLTGYSELPEWKKLILAPSQLRKFFIESIAQETALGTKGRIVAKVNAILEPSVIRALYAASRAGVKIDLICRGICGLRPGLPGISENIRVTSIVDRFLEHSRIYYFGNQGKPKVLIGSADWMDRNLLRRVEVVFPIEDPMLKARLIQYLSISLNDNVKARSLLSDGNWQRVVPKEGEPLLRSQQYFLEMSAQDDQKVTLNPPLDSIPLPDSNLSRATIKEMLAVRTKPGSKRN